jgi:Ca2+-binding RTX toxin-like protein
LSEFTSSSYTAVNWGRVQWNEITSASTYSSINYNSVQYSEFTSSSYTAVNWGRVQWNEITSASTYSSINYNSVQYSEFTSSSYSAVNWGQVQWNEITSASTYSSIDWEYIEFSEMDSKSIQTVRTSLSKSSFQSVRVEVGLNTADNLSGDSAGNQLFGLKGNDALNGRGGNDELFGCYTETGGGRGEVDQYTGGAGKDLFALGTESGVLYDDGRRGSSGAKDYVVVKDFTVRQDRLQLHGNKSDYFLGASPVRGVAGQGLFHDTNNNSRLDKSDELIGVLQSNSALTRQNTIDTAQFV